VSGRVRLSDRDAIRLGGTILTFCAPPPTLGGQTVAGDELAVPRLTEQQHEVLAALCRPHRDDSHPYPVPASNAQLTQDLCLSLDAVKPTFGCSTTSSVSRPCPRTKPL
jgi:hypothetical protein